MHHSVTLDHLRNILRRRFGLHSWILRDTLWRGFCLESIIYQHIILRFSWGSRRFFWWESHSLASSILIRISVSMCECDLVPNYQKRGKGANSPPWQGIRDGTRTSHSWPSKTRDQADMFFSSQSSHNLNKDKHTKHNNITSIQQRKNHHDYEYLSQEQASFPPSRWFDSSSFHYNSSYGY